MSHDEEKGKRQEEKVRERRGNKWRERKREEEGKVVEKGRGRISESEVEKRGIIKKMGWKLKKKKLEEGK